MKCTASFARQPPAHLPAQLLLILVPEPAAKSVHNPDNFPLHELPPLRRPAGAAEHAPRLRQHVVGSGIVNERRHEYEKLVRWDGGLPEVMPLHSSLANPGQAAVEDVERLHHGVNDCDEA